MKMHPSKLALESFSVMSPQGCCDRSTGLREGLHSAGASSGKGGSLRLEIHDTSIDQLEQLLHVLFLDAGEGDPHIVASGSDEANPVRVQQVLAQGLALTPLIAKHMKYPALKG